MARRGLKVAALVLVAGCGVGTPNEAATSDDAQAVLGSKYGKNLPANECRTVGIRTAATGTVRSAPDVGMIGVAPVGDAVQSMYFETSALGPETRRGVVEFQVPALDGRIESAQLLFIDQHPWQLQPVDPLTHQYFTYNTADGDITADDFAREAQPLGTLTTDLNSMTQATHAIDVTGATALGQGLGFRIELERKSTGSGTFGSAFVDFRLDLKLCDESALPNGSISGLPSGLAH
jgi:hypothetical protein